MNQVKRILGFLWILIGAASIIILVYSAFTNINHSPGEIGKPVPWIIILAVFTPIAVGLVIFGWYATKGEFDKKVKS